MTDTGETIAPDRASGLYRKKPVTVQARQLIDDLANHASIAAWIEAGSGHAEIPFAEPCLYIETLEGRMRADIGDWVIKGVKGEFYPVKPDIFEATYGGAGNSGDATRGQAARKAWDDWHAGASERGRGKPGYDEKADTDAGWEVAADAGIGASGLREELEEARRELAEHRELAHNLGDVRRIDELTAENGKLSGSCQLLARTLSMYVRSLYATWIDAAQHRNLKAVIEGLAESLDGFDGTEWNGTETGTEWLERTRGEDVVSEAIGEDDGAPGAMAAVAGGDQDLADDIATRGLDHWGGQHDDD
jgi:hypothetical protein